MRSVAPAAGSQYLEGAVFRLLVSKLPKLIREVNVPGAWTFPLGGMWVGNHGSGESSMWGNSLFKRRMTVFLWTDNLRGLPVPSHGFTPHLGWRSCSGSEPIGATVLELQDASTTSQLGTGTSGTAWDSSLAEFLGWTLRSGNCGQLCVAWVGLQPEDAREIAPGKSQKWMELVCVTRVKRKRNYTCWSKCVSKSWRKSAHFGEFLIDFHKSVFSLGAEAVEVGCW